VKDTRKKRTRRKRKRWWWWCSESVLDHALHVLFFRDLRSLSEVVFLEEDLPYWLTSW